MKKVLAFLVSILLLACIAGGIFAFHFYSTTMSEAEIKAYFPQNSKSGATDFGKYVDFGYMNYAFYVAEDRDFGEQEELIIFQEKPFGPILRTKQWVHISSNCDSNIVGKFLFRPVLESGLEENTQLLLLFSSNAEKMVRCVYTYAENDVERSAEKRFAENEYFIFSVNNLGIKNGIDKQMRDAKFYNAQGGLVHRIQF